MSKKILVVLCSEPKWGGEHQYALTLAECLKEMEDIDLMAVCSSRFWKNWCREQKLPVLNVSWPVFEDNEQKWHIKYSLFSKIYSMYMTDFGKAVRREKITAVIVTIQGLFLPNFHVKMIVPVHDLMHRYEGRFPEVKSEYNKRELIFSSKAKYAWCVLTDSMVGRQQFIESYSSYIRKGMPYVTSLPFVVPPHIAMLQEEPIEVPDKYIFYPAQFWKHKNHLHLIQAIKLLQTEIADIHLVLVGSEKNALREVKKYISDNGLENNITMKGFVNDGNITYLYRHAVGMIMPSYFGPTNIPPLEAMALGCPAAVSNKYAMPEQVGDAGLLFDPDDPKEMAACIKAMWLDDTLRQDMIKKGYDRIARWTKREYKNKLQTILKHI